MRPFSIVSSSGSVSLHLAQPVMPPTPDSRNLYQGVLSHGHPGSSLHIRVFVSFSLPLQSEDNAVFVKMGHAKGRKNWSLFIFLPFLSHKGERAHFSEPRGNFLQSHYEQCREELSQPQSCKCRHLGVTWMQTDQRGPPQSCF